MSESSLDHLRIRRLAVLRRAQHRSALFMLGFAGLCVVMACAAVVEAYGQFHHRRYPMSVGLFATVAPLLWLSRIAWRKRGRILDEIRSAHIGFPLDPPDFSTLQNGSQIARSLEEMLD